MKHVFALAVLAAMASPAQADIFTDPAQAKPVLQAIAPQWVGIRPYGGQDLLYLTNVLSYRCAIATIRVSVNGGPLTDWDREPCHHGETPPNALKMETHLPYATAPLDSLQSVTVELGFADGTSLTQSYARAAILLP